MKISLLVPAALAAALILPLAACGADGEETRCGDYLKQSQKDQRTTVKEVVKGLATDDAERRKADEAQDEDLDVFAAMLADSCQKDGNKDKTIRQLLDEGRDSASAPASRPADG